MRMAIKKQLRRVDHHQPQETRLTPRRGVNHHPEGDQGRSFTHTSRTSRHTRTHTHTHHQSSTLRPRRLLGLQLQRAMRKLPEQKTSKRSRPSASSPCHQYKRPRTDRSKRVLLYRYFFKRPYKYRYDHAWSLITFAEERLQLSLQRFNLRNSMKLAAHLLHHRLQGRAKTPVAGAFHSIWTVLSGNSAAPRLEQTWLHFLHSASKMAASNMAALVHSPANKPG